MKLIIIWSIFVYCIQAGCDCRGGASANFCCCNPWACINSASNIAESNIVESRSTSFSTCPQNTPESGDQCNFENTCYYGEESCCIEDKIETFNSYGCKCENGRTLCFYTEACMAAPATCNNGNNPDTSVCGGMENCAVYETGHKICECDDFGEHCVYNELSDENISPRKCTKCTDEYILNTATGVCQNESDIFMRRRLIMTNDNSVVMSIGIIIGALIILSIIIGVLIVFYYKQKRATVDLLANTDNIHIEVV